MKVGETSFAQQKITWRGEKMTSKRRQSLASIFYSKFIQHEHENATKNTPRGSQIRPGASTMRLGIQKKGVH